MTKPQDGLPREVKRMDHEEILRAELHALEAQHRDLDQAIHALHETGTGDSLTIKRLKRQKLQLKDQITRLKDQILPDIIA